LDDKHVVFGQVVKGMAVVKYLENVRTGPNDVPIEVSVDWIFFLFKSNLLFIKKRCVIEDCGQFKPGEDFGLCENDGTEDVFPSFPEDTDLDFTSVCIQGLYFS
jgi:hypothetical protein